MSVHILEGERVVSPERERSLSRPGAPERSRKRRLLFLRSRGKGQLSPGSGDGIVEPFLDASWFGARGLPGVPESDQQIAMAKQMVLNRWLGTQKFAEPAKRG